MNTPTPNNAARSTPVAWQERHRKSDGSWDNWRMCTKAYFQAYAHSSSEDYQVRELVPAATVAALEAEVAENEGVIAVWRRRCEEAERRVGELEAELRQAMELLAYATYHDGRYKQRESEKFQRPAYSLLVKLAYRFNVNPYDSVTGADPT